jgi:4-amino-4-deoxy-L-arabinose transferase-like glycosyltransferase
MLGNGFLSLTNPDEVFYTQTAKEMLKYKTWLVPYLFDHPQFEKPVLTYWLLRIGFIFFGVSAFSARFFPALFAMIGAIAVYLLALLGYKDGKRAFICALVLASSGFYIGLARTVFTDMIFSIFILLSLLSFFWGYINTAKKARGITLCFIFSGLAVLTKGPLGLLIPMLAIVLFLVIRKDLRFLFSQYSLLGFLLFLVIAVPWYMLMIKKFGNSFVYEFFYNNHIRRVLEAEHPGNDTWYFYPASMILPMFPWCIYVPVSFFYLFKRLKEKPPQLIYIYLASWIIAVFIIFEVVHSKLVSYILPLFPALAIITGDFISNAILKKQKLIYVITLITWFILLLLPIALAIGSAKYPLYFPSRIPVYYFIFLYYLIFLPVILLLIFRKKLWLAVYLLMVQVPLFLSFALTIHKGFEAYVSSRDACEYLLNNYTVDNTILCSKFLVRGVRYYTDKDVAVAKIGGPGLFSPHPIPYLDSDTKVAEFLKNQPITYCILNKSSLIDIQRISVDNKFKIDILNRIGDENIVRINTGLR